MSVSQRDHFKSHLRTFNAAALTQYAALKENEKRNKDKKINAKQKPKQTKKNTNKTKQ